MAASRFNPLSKAALAAGLAATALLAACGEHHAAPAQEPSAPAPRPDALAGAPTDMPAPPPVPADAPPPPPVPIERPGDKDVVYDLGPVVGPHDTMAPIPNPPETGPVHARLRERPHRHPVAPHRPQALRPRPVAPAAAHPQARTRPAARGSVAHTPKPAPVKPAKPAASVKPARPVTPAKPLAPASHASSNAAQPQPATTGDRGTKLTALQSTLRDAVAASAVLTAPPSKPDQAQDVTLTLPAGFATQVRDEAAKQGLQDAASSVNMTALLAGDGYKIAPDETQSQPLTVGQPTEFHWTVTAQPGAHGPFHADVGADLLGGGDSALQLGSVTPHGGFHISPRAWGALLLVLLAVLVFAWISRSSRNAAAQRRVREDRRKEQRLYERPLDMGAAPPLRRDDEL